MMYAQTIHKDQKRKYTNDHYSIHLGEVAGIVATVDTSYKAIATAWLHDSIEDQGETRFSIERRFGCSVALGVHLLSDLEEGNRATRKLLNRQRLANAPGWVQTIKVADLISNTRSIVKHDPKFAVTYLEEKRLLLSCLRKADKGLWREAWDLASLWITHES